MEKSEYDLQHASMDEINRELDSYWGELRQTDSPLRKQALAAGINADQLDSLAKLDRNQALSLKVEGAGLGLITTTLIVAFAPVAAKVTKDLWTIVFVPMLKRKFGQDAITDKKSDKGNE